MEIEREGIARCQCNPPKSRMNDSAVLDTRCNKRDQTAFGRRDHAPVDHRAARIAAFPKVQATPQEFLIVNIDGRCDEAAHVNPGVLTEQDAVGVDQDDLSIGDELSQN